MGKKRYQSHPRAEHALGRNSYEDLAWAVIANAMRAVKRGNESAALWLESEGKEWLNLMGVDAEMFLDRVFSYVQA